MALENVMQTAASYAVQGTQKSIDFVKNTTPGSLVVDLCSTYYFMDVIARNGIVSKETATTAAAFILLSVALRTAGGSTPVTGAILKTTLMQTALKLVDGKVFAYAFTGNTSYAAYKDRRLISVSGWGYQYKGALKLLVGLAYFGVRSADIYMFVKNGQGLFAMLRANPPQFLKSLPGVSRFI